MGISDQRGCISGKEKRIKKRLRRMRKIHSLQPLFLLVIYVVLNHNIVSAAFYNGNAADECDSCLLLQFLDIQCAAVAHGGTDLAGSQFNTVMKRSGIGNIAVNT